MKSTQILRFVVAHALNRRRPLSALLRVLRWQLAARLLPEAEFSLPFVNGTRLLVTRGMTGATGNFYCGLHEPDEMGFALHVLRPGDLFVDIGANVGSFSILAASVSARVMAVEPIPTTYGRLIANIRLNDAQSLVTPQRVGLSERAGTLRFTADGDTVNHVLADNETTPAIDVPVTTVDSLVADLFPSLIKIDVEGHELSVLNGAAKTLQKPSLLAVIMETNGSGLRYGIRDDELYKLMHTYGFEPHSYSGTKRVLSRLDVKSARPAANTIFVAPGRADEVRARVSEAPRASLVNGSI